MSSRLNDMILLQKLLKKYEIEHIFIHRNTTDFYILGAMGLFETGMIRDR